MLIPTTTGTATANATKKDAKIAAGIIFKLFNVHIIAPLIKPKYKTRQLKKRIAKKNQISKKILSFEIETRKFDIQQYPNKNKGEENVL